MPIPNLVDALKDEQAGARNTRIACYAALVNWPEPASNLPGRTELREAAGVSNATVSTAFGNGKYPRLVTAMFGRPYDPAPPSTFAGVSRIVIEAKEFTLIPWLQGWHTDSISFEPIRRAESLVRVVSSWAIANRGLAALDPGTSPPVLRRAARTLHERDEVIDDVVMLTRSSIADTIAKGSRATPVSGLDSVRVALRDLFDDPTSDAQRRSRELSAAIGNYMLMLGNPDEVDPVLASALQAAAAAVSAVDGEVAS